MTTVKADALLFVTAMIWGFAFVAQRAGMEHVGPFTYSGVRFALGSLVLLPLLGRRAGSRPPAAVPALGERAALLGALGAGVFLFAGVSLQQVGLVYTTAGNAGFITGLYVVIVPLLGLFWGHRPAAGTWIGALLAAAGLYLLSVSEALTIAFGDLLVLAGAFVWAGHVLLIGWLSRRMRPLAVAFIQFSACAVLSLATAWAFETPSAQGIRAAAVPILYGGVLSVGVAYTLQVVAQRYAQPSHAAILLSLEAVFAAIGGWAILDERMSARGLLGGALMLTGMLVSQLWRRRRARIAAG
jgi:drug/metabolite transporter (DMT)-like permease